MNIISLLIWYTYLKIQWPLRSKPTTADFLAYIDLINHIFKTCFGRFPLPNMPIPLKHKGKRCFFYRMPDILNETVPLNKCDITWKLWNRIWGMQIDVERWVSWNRVSTLRFLITLNWVWVGSVLVGGVTLFEGKTINQLVHTNT